MASFYCAARGDPPPSIVWRKNSKKVSGKLQAIYAIWRKVMTPQNSHILVSSCAHILNAGTQSRYTVLEQPGGVSILRIEPVRAGRDDAPYECVAENGVGDAVSADATLTIYEGKWQHIQQPRHHGISG